MVHWEEAGAKMLLDETEEGYDSAAEGQMRSKNDETFISIG